MRDVNSAVDDSVQVAGSLSELGGEGVEFKVIDGFEPGRSIRIGSLSAGDLIIWSEANEDGKRTAGLRLITKSLVGPEPENKRYADNPANIELFRRKRHKDTERIVKEILKFNGMNVTGGQREKND